MNLLFFLFSSFSHFRAISNPADSGTELNVVNYMNTINSSSTIAYRPQLAFSLHSQIKEHSMIQ